MNEAEEVKITETIDVVVTKKDGLSLEKFWSKMPKRITVKTAIIIAAIIILAAVGYVYKGLFVAATVNGYPISRLAVVRELEKVAGKNTLDALINKKLVSDEAGKQEIKVSDDEINAEIKRVEDQVKAQGGGTLDAALKAQGMTLDSLKQEIVTQKNLEKLLADKMRVTDEEVQQYIKTNKVDVPNGEDAQLNEQIKNSLIQQKLNSEAAAFIKNLRSEYKVNYFVNY